ncbi:RNA-directed DNA polymerase (Reverse transcriptase), Ribonuclease H [Gossypium australe]|uniref:RNA-directed DNA polymerase (Reverse transcriptase), Ribonuclease H n=1 Tax=Gossypium australe TaxID=47621 RepID=A0A5B6WHG8_9ROSI|nr:RNA-directed DNA polymerase (Reverse transcriptase), Ribonuclease H [Gossypium australe]
MLYHTTWLISKLDPLKYLMESITLNGRKARWSAIVDFLPSRALEDYEPLNFGFPNENPNTLQKIFLGNKTSTEYQMRWVTELEQSWYP